MFIRYYFFNCAKLYVTIIWLNLTLSWSQKCTFYLKNSQHKHKSNSYWFIFLPENFWTIRLSGWFTWIILPPLQTRCASFRHVPPFRFKIDREKYRYDRRKCIPRFTAGAAIAPNNSRVSLEMLTRNKK